MQLNNTSKYAVRILSYVAGKRNEELCNAKELSKTLDIPYKFLTKIMTKLVRLNFIISTRGKGGGYRLSRPASDISIMEVLNEFNEFLQQNHCILGIGMCDNKNRCGLHDQWEEPKKGIKNMLKNTTLEDIGKNGLKI